MITENYSTVRQNLKAFCDRVAEENVDLIVTRKEHSDVVMMSLERYSRILDLEKLIKLAEWKTRNVPNFGTNDKGEQTWITMR